MPRATRIVRGVIAFTLFALVSGCEFHCSVGGPSEPKVAGPLAAAPTGDTFPGDNDLSPVYTDTETFYVAWSHPEAVQGDTVTARLVAVEVGAAAAPGTQVLELPHTLEGDLKGGYFSFTKPDQGWPAGHYRVDVARNGQAFGTAEIDITRR